MSRLVLLAAVLCTLALAAASPASAAQRIGWWQYGTAEDGTKLYIDVFRSASTPKTNARVVLLVHGGGFVRGDGKPGDMWNYANALADRGFLTAYVSYRLVDSVATREARGYEAVSRDAQHDVQSAVRWMKINAGAFGASNFRIYVAGYSAGGFVAQRVAYRNTDQGWSGNTGVNSTVRAAASIAGAECSSAVAQWTFTSWTCQQPYNYGDASVLAIYGTADPVVPPWLVTAACDAANAANAWCIPQAIEGADHQVGNTAFAQIVDLIAKRFNEI